MSLNEIITIVCIGAIYAALIAWVALGVWLIIRGPRDGP